MTLGFGFFRTEVEQTQNKVLAVLLPEIQRTNILLTAILKELMKMNGKAEGPGDE